MAWSRVLDLPVDVLLVVLQFLSLHEKLQMARASPFIRKLIQHTPGALLVVEVPKEWKDSRVATEDGFMLRALDLDGMVRCLWVTDQHYPEGSFSHVMRVFHAVEELVIQHSAWTSNYFIRTMQRTETRGITRLRFLTDKVLTPLAFESLVQQALDSLDGCPLQEVTVGTEHVWKRPKSKPKARSDILTEARERDRLWLEEYETRHGLKLEVYLDQSIDETEAAVSSSQGLNPQAGTSGQSTRHLDPLRAYVNQRNARYQNISIGRLSMEMPRTNEERARMIEHIWGILPPDPAGHPPETTPIRVGSRFRIKRRPGPWAPHSSVLHTKPSRNLEDY
ncbi:hypothetical protein BJ684DRAFT_19522 [Piptocephalis cylindrospora]|uniref:F-box domain-containing protein n=1 Tax=Piptocephalis cylindrospora TaxID=1907219 RepID=A0A4P9Y4W8_9FUNG|nr:hypothetical protein BJ684DRAFT_19522 [Piptocephalis cylindrospora]|eukprot:RKP14038.1 hypothetical protein BJ684DRAFT_19522 [Piptocephalis cylindrospora]